MTEEEEDGIDKVNQEIKKIWGQVKFPVPGKDDTLDNHYVD